MFAECEVQILKNAHFSSSVQFAKCTFYVKFIKTSVNREAQYLGYWIIALHSCDVGNLILNFKMHNYKICIRRYSKSPNANDT